jgi:SAM-dependent methyltransferase
MEMKMKTITLERLGRAARKVYANLRYPLPSMLANFEYNAALWDKYATMWTTQIDRVAAVREKESSLPLAYLGDEWGIADVEEVMGLYIFPNLTETSVVAEIGSGGGRLASKVIGRVGELYCLDVSRKMLERCKVALARHANVNYVLLQEPQLSSIPPKFFDFIYSFDVFVHLDLHVMWKYFQEIARTLKPDGTAFIHVANLTTPLGWKRFESQQTFCPEGFYFISPDIVAILAQHAGLRILPQLRLSAQNSYNRDYMAMLSPAADPG